MTPDAVREQGQSLLDYATHFSQSDWNYTRDLGKLHSIRYDLEHETLRGRVKRACGYLFSRQAEWEKELPVPRWRMAKHVMRRDRNLPDGVLDNGGILVYWEENGEYIQKVQPSVGELVARFLLEDPGNPHAVRIAAELERIAAGYRERLDAAKGDSA